MASFTRFSSETRFAMYPGMASSCSLPDPLADDDGSDHRDQQEERGDLERHEVVAVQRHSDRLGVSDHLGLRRLTRRQSDRAPQIVRRIDRRRVLALHHDEREEQEEQDSP